MHLSHTVLVNWGSLRSGTFDFAQTTLLTGSSGSGKSMLLDAIQSVMTGTMANICKFNQAQSEKGDKHTRNKEYRTLEGYILGQIDQRFSRTAAQGYIACVFEPSSVLELVDPFTAILGAVAAVDSGKARLDRLALFLVKGRVTEDHLMPKSGKGGRMPLPLDDARSTLERAFGSARVLSFGKEKGDYLQCLYANFEGLKQISAEEAKSSARSWVKATAFRPVDTVNELIRDEILDEKDMADDAAKTAAVMRSMRDLNIEGVRIQASLEALRKIQSAGESSRGQYLALATAELAQAQYRVNKNQENLQSAQADQAACTAGLERLQSDLDAVAGDREAVTLQLDTVKSQLASVPAAAQENKLRSDIEDAETTIATKSQQLKSSLAALYGLQKGIGDVVSRLSVEPRLTKTLEPVAALAQAIDLEGTAKLVAELDKRLDSNKDIESLKKRLTDAQVQDAALVSALTTCEENLFEAIVGAQASLKRELEDIAEATQQTRKRLQVLDSGQFEAPESILAAKALIESELPGAKPRLLAELVDPVANSPWMPVIEGYMGLSRFKIVVEVAHEKAAMALLRGYRSSRGGPAPQVLQGARLLAQFKGEKVTPGSIVEELATGNPIVGAFLAAQYGRVLKLADLEALQKASQGVILEGLAAGGFSVYPCALPDHKLVFGAASREASKKKALADIAGFESEKITLTTRHTLCRDYSAVIRGIKATNLIESFEPIVGAQITRAAALTAIEGLDLTSITDLRSQEQAFKAELTALDAKRSKIDKDMGGKERDRSAARERIALCRNEIEGRQAKLDTQLGALQALADVDFSIDMSAISDQAGKLATAAPNEEKLAAQLTPNRNAFWDNVRKLREAISSYNGRCKPSEMVSGVLQTTTSGAEASQVFPEIGPVLLRVADQIRLQEGHALAKVADQLGAAEKEFNKVFTSMFAQKMFSNIEEGVKTLQALNNQIQGVPFGKDTYRVTWEMVPQYAPYYAFYRSLRTHAEDLGNGKTIEELELSDEQARVHKELRELLLSNDANAADKRLKQITDWRNYRSYDIVRKRIDNGSESSLSTWGTGSGGETQTPFYVVRAAVLAASLRHQNSSASHLNMLTLDEAFSNMDTKRSRNVMEFLKNTFGFQVIIAMPTASNSKVKPLSDLEYSFAMVSSAGAGGVGMVTMHDRTVLKREAISNLFTTGLAERAAIVRAQAAANDEDEAA